MAYLSLMSILANLLLGRTTDKIQKRSIFLYPLIIVLALVTFLFPLATSNFIFWLIITGIVTFIVPLFYNVSTAFIVDAQPNLRVAIPGREFILSTGRLTGITATLISFYLQPTPKIIFLILGTIMAIYPAILYYRTKKSKKYNFSYR